MPYHKIPRARLHDDIRALEHEHEIVVQVLNRPDDPEHVDVFTRVAGATDGLHLRSGS